MNSVKLHYRLIFAAAGFWGWVMTAGYGQAPGAGRIVVHLDKSFYVNGEVIWYKVYLPAEFGGEHPALKVELLDGAGTTMHYSFLKTRGALYAHGHYKIPYDLQSGLYYLVFLASEPGGLEPVQLAEVAVPIYNDEVRSPFTAAAGGQPWSPATAAGSLPATLQVALSVGQDRVQSRGPVRATVSVRDGAGRPVRANLSVAVTDWELAGTAVCGGPTVHVGADIDQGTAPRLDTAVHAKVRITDAAGNPLQANVLGVYSAYGRQLTFAKSDPAGFSYVALPDFPGSQPVQILGYYKETEEIKVELLEEEVPVGPAQLLMNEGIEAYLELSRRRKKIFQHRTALEFELEEGLPPPNPVVLEPDMTIHVQEYQSFDNLGTFFKEVGSPLRFRKRDDHYWAQVSNPGAQNKNYFLPGSPMFIIDGKVTRNADFVARMPPDEVQKVELFFRRDGLRRHFNVFGNGGVVILTTSIPDVDIPEADADDQLFVNGLQADAAFPVFRPGQEGAGARQAFFRPQLYWNPVVETDDAGRAAISFHQSDDLGIFRIEVVAQSGDGAIGRAVLEYEVR